MKHNYSLKAALLSLACLMMLAFLLQNTAEATLQEDLDRYRWEYENLYKQYSESLKQNVNSTSAELAKKVQTAKRQYDETLAKFKMSQTTKDKIKQTADNVADTIGRVFSTGSASAPTEPGYTPHELPGFATMPISIDGDNYCGQFAMTSVLNGMGIPTGAQDIYKQTNPAGIFTAPPTIVETLRMKGLDATERHNCSIDDIVKKIDGGKPALVLMNSGSGTPHWVAVYGYKTDSSGQVKSLTLRDSYWGTKGPYDMDVERFKDLWNAPLGSKFPGNLAGYKNLMIDIGEAGEKQKSPHLANFNFWTATEDNLSSGINDIVTGFKNLSPTQFAGGLAKSILGIPGAVLGLSGNGFSTLGKKLTDYGKERFKQDGFGNKLLGGASVVAGGLSKAVGWVGKAAGNVVSSAASMTGNLFKKLGYVFR
ncbi:MAG: C39 family peptidase [Candidatus Rifleibacteriota bacterium]